MNKDFIRDYLNTNKVELHFKPIVECTQKR